VLESDHRVRRLAGHRPSAKSGKSLAASSAAGWLYHNATKL
jgi:hypothetical protein